MNVCTKFQAIFQSGLKRWTDQPLKWQMDRHCLEAACKRGPGQVEQMCPPGDSKLYAQRMFTSAWRALFKAKDVSRGVPDVLSVLQHRQTDGALLIGVQLLIIQTHLQVLGYSLQRDFNYWSVSCRSGYVCATGVSESAQTRRKESPNHASQWNEKIDIRWKTLNYFFSLTMYQMIWHSFHSIWVIFSGDAFLNSFHAHICRQLDESSLALNCAHCRPVSLICQRKLVWPLNCCESRDPVSTLVSSLWSLRPHAALFQARLSHQAQLISHPVLRLQQTTSNRCIAQLAGKKMTILPFCTYGGKWISLWWFGLLHGSRCPVCPPAAEAPTMQTIWICL